MQQFADLEGIDVTDSGYEELGFAKLDTDRKARQGFSEVVYCDGKADDYLAEIFAHLYQANGEVLGTRASRHQYEVVRAVLPQIHYDEKARILQLQDNPPSPVGNIVVCTAGTADIPVAEEAAQTAEFLGGKVTRIYDVGVSGIHRVFSQMDKLQKANCVISVAGMEGALTSVLGGLVSCPVIGVPTSIGYGANLQGVSALLSMLTSCANGVAVVNIDNGYGAGYMATQINRQSCGCKKE